MCFLIPVLFFWVCFWASSETTVGCIVKKISFYFYNYMHMHNTVLFKKKIYIHMVCRKFTIYTYKWFISLGYNISR